MIAIVVVALVAVGGGVFAVTMRGGGGGEVADEPRAPASSPQAGGGGAPSSDLPEAPEPPAVTELPVATEVPSSTAVPEPGDDGPSDGSLGPSVPDLLSGTGELSPPAELPRPAEAVPDELTGGLSVPGTASEAVSFYEGALPDAGYGVERSEVPGVAAVLAVAGRGLDGQLVFIELGLGSTTVFWIPA